MSINKDQEEFMEEIGYQDDFGVKEITPDQEKVIAELELAQRNCKEHEYFSMYRHPGSNMRCKKCDKIITHDEYLKLYGHDILQKQIDKLKKELYCKKQELGNQKIPTESQLSKGWICPVCGRGNSPMNMTCSCRSMYTPNNPWQNPVTYYPPTYKVGN